MAGGLRYGMLHATGASLHEINDVEPQLCCQNDQKLTKISNFVTVPGTATCRTRMRTTTGAAYRLGIVKADICSMSSRPIAVCFRRF